MTLFLLTSIEISFVINSLFEGLEMLEMSLALVTVKPSLRVLLKAVGAFEGVLLNGDVGVSLGNFHQ